MDIIYLKTSILKGSSLNTLKVSFSSNLWGMQTDKIMTVVEIDNYFM